MATPLRTSPRRTSLRRAGLALAGALGVLLATTPAAAEPGAPATSADAARLVAERGHQLEVVTEQFNEARHELETQQAAAAAAAAEVEEVTAVLAQAREAVRGVARSAYTGGSHGSFQALMTSDSAEEFVGRVSTLQAIAGHQNGILGRAAEADVAAARAHATAQQAATEAQATYDAVAGQHAQLTRQIADYQAQFARLSSAEQRAVVSSHHAAEPEDAAAERTTETMASRDDRTAPTGPVVAGSGAAQVIVDAAMSQRGKPYVWGAGGPGSYDCSGLTQYAYRAAGVSVPHSSRLQSGMGQAVPRDQLQPGDMVFFYQPVSHVGIYIGNGQMVHAPTSGDVVKVSRIDSMGGYVGARRLI